MKNSITILLMSSFPFITQGQWSSNGDSNRGTQWYTSQGVLGYSIRTDNGGGWAWQFTDGSNNPYLHVQYPTGNVGIGTISPVAKLTISGTLAEKGLYIQTNDSWLAYSDGNNYFRGTSIFAETSNSHKVGIGTATPEAKLHVHDETALPQASGSFHLLERISGRGHNYFMKSTWMLRDDGTTTQWWTTRLHDGISIDNVYLTPGVDTRTWWERDPMHNIQSWGHGNETYFTINQSNVGIGTTTPDAKLAVNGTIHTKEVKVDMNGWSDFVFDPDYKLQSLNEVEAYIKSNQHLPNVPSAKEVEANGVNLGEMNKILLQKIEELTLYVIELKKENEEIKNEIKQIKK